MVRSPQIHQIISDKIETTKKELYKTFRFIILVQTFRLFPVPTTDKPSKRLFHHERHILLL